MNPEVPPPGTYHTSWIGNSFGGAGAGYKEGVGFRYNAYGQWVQDNVGVMAVTPDGTVFNDVIWDEGGHGLGLYKNGQPNRVPVNADKAPEHANGVNTSGSAVCVDGGFFYVANIAKGLLWFSWTAGDINSTRYLGDVRLADRPVGMSCAKGKILLGYPDRLELRDEVTRQVTASFPASGISAVLLAPEGGFWVIAHGAVRHLGPDGKDLGVSLSGIGKPTSLAWGKDGQLIVTDDGPAQQVLFFDISGTPKLASTFGVKGGLYAGVPGEVAPQKLFGLRGAGMDAQGNLYVGMALNDVGASGNAFIRAFSPAGAELWEDYAAAFLDVFGFEPGSDGGLVYGRTTKWSLDLKVTAPGKEAKLVAVTVDPQRDPGDPRIAGGFSVYPRRFGQQTLLYASGQYGKGFRIFAGAPGTEILHEVGQSPATGWAWFLTDDGDVWNGDMGRRIALYRFHGMAADRPVYDWQHPETWPWPADFRTVTRVIYDKPKDRLYVFGWLNGQDPQGVWGVVGLTARRYDGWMSGHPHIAWTNDSLPQAAAVTSNGQVLLPPKEVSLAGDYLFFGEVKSLQASSVPKVNILRTADGSYAGTLTAGPEIGGIGGLEDMVNCVKAIRRADGEYLVLVEDDWRAKNILFRWTP